MSEEKPIKVFALLAGYDHEGQSFEGVFASKVAAEAKRDRLNAEWTTDKCEPDDWEIREIGLALPSPTIADQLAEALREARLELYYQIRGCLPDGDDDAGRAYAAGCSGIRDIDAALAAYDASKEKS